MGQTTMRVTAKETKCGLPNPKSVGKRTILRNTVLLSAGMAALYGMNQLAVAVATTTFALVSGRDGLAGIGPAIFLTTAAFAAFMAGRAMDRLGRVPVLAGGRSGNPRLRTYRLRCFAAFDSGGDRRIHPDRGFHGYGNALSRRGGRYVPARAPGPRHSAGPVRRCLRRAPRTARLRPTFRW